MDVKTKTALSQNGSVITETTTPTNPSTATTRTVTPVSDNGSNVQGGSNHKTMADTLLEQLHEQYAVNNNSNLGSIITIIVSLVAVFGGYGYVYLNSIPIFSNKFSYLYDKFSDAYYLDALLLAFCASIIVIAILWCLCVYQGIHQRNEQFIIDAIRHKAFGHDLNNTTYIFPKGYHPYYKEGPAIIQGIYGELVNILKWISILLAISVLIKVVANMIIFPAINPLGVWEFIISFIFAIAVLWESHEIYEREKERYKKREKEFLYYRLNDIHNK